MELGARIATYRKNRNLTQDELARQFDISNQAVSKWETGQSYPDVELLPKIADFFEVSLDELFGREFVRLAQDVIKVEVPEIKLPEAVREASSWSVVSVGASKEEVDAADEFAGAMNEITGAADEFAGAMNEITGAVNDFTGTAEELAYVEQLPITWDNDKTLRAVLYKGRELVKAEELKTRFGHICNKFSFSYNGPALNVKSTFSVNCCDVQGSVTAGSYVECEDVQGNVASNNYVECNDVGGNVASNNYVECGDVGGNVAANGYVECQDVGDSVTAAGYVECDDVGGNVSVASGGYVECGDVGGNVTAEGNVECGDVGGSVSAGGRVN